MNKLICFLFGHVKAVLFGHVKAVLCYEVGRNKYLSVNVKYEYYCERCGKVFWIREKTE